MKVEKTTTFRSDIAQEYIRQYYNEYGILLHFTTRDHDAIYKKPWERIPEANKYDYMQRLVKDREELLKLYLEDQQLNNIPLRHFDKVPKELCKKVLGISTWAPYMNTSCYKGMLRDILGTTNSEEVGITLYCVEDYGTGVVAKYIFASDNFEDVEPYLNQERYKIWRE